MVFSFIPRRWLNRRFGQDENIWNILFSNLLILIIGLIYATFFFPLKNDSYKISWCLMQLIFGLPCPGCGMTKALLHLFRGNLTQALIYNPVSFFLLGFICFQILGQLYVLWKKIDMSLMRMVYQWLEKPLLLALMLNWGYQLIFVSH